MPGCKCCRNFRLLQIRPDPVRISTLSAPGWYRLYAPTGTQPVWIYQATGSTKYTDYSTDRPPNCKDPSIDLVGQAEVFYGCVEDQINTMGSGDKGYTQGFTNTVLTGRFKAPVKGLYLQKRCFGWYKAEGRFTDDLDVADAIFGELMFRSLPTGKLVPMNVFGQPFELLFSESDQGLDFVDRSAEMSMSLPVVVLPLGTGVKVDVDYVLSGLSLTGDYLLLRFTYAIDGQLVDLTPGFTAEVQGREIKIVREGAGSSCSFRMLRFGYNPLI